MNQGAASLRRTVAALGALAVVCGLAFVLVYQGTVRTRPGRLFGNASLRGAMLTHSGISDLVDGALAVVSAASLLGAVAAVAVIALIRLRRSLGLAAIGLLIGANVSTWLLKNLALSRPDLGLRELTPATLNSLPSGHTTAAFSAVVALLFVMPGRWRGSTAAVGAGYACLTALATMSAGWHRAGDSLAAFLLVGAWAAVAGLAVVLFGGRRRPAAGALPAARRWKRWPALASVGSLALGLMLGLISYATDRLRDDTFGAVLAFLAGALLIAGTATAVLIAILDAVDRIASGPEGPESG